MSQASVAPAHSAAPAAPACLSPAPAAPAALAPASAGSAASAWLAQGWQARCPMTWQQWAQSHAVGGPQTACYSAAALGAVTPC
eukprot:360150-Pelagomonas_calceolata.AAC.6